jgi:hypothetical protein
LKRIAGRSIIAPQRNYMAHLHRPCRAIYIKHLQKLTVWEDEVKTVFQPVFAPREISDKQANCGLELASDNPVRIGPVMDWTETSQKAKPHQ